VPSVAAPPALLGMHREQLLDNQAPEKMREEGANFQK
jgi:hypothetical protein